MNCGIIIVAAGRGRRMGAGINKQFIELNNKPILIHTLEKFENKKWIKEKVLVVHPEEISIIGELLSKYKINVDKIVPGGKERQDSVERGLSFIESEFVMVHDGARPFVNPQKLDELFESVKNDHAVILGVPVKDTIKITDDSGFIMETPNRKSLWSIQTPQAFRLSILKDAYEKAKSNLFLGTDDASLVERIGVNVKVIKGDYRNIKITTPEDLELARLILNNGVWRP